jgi:hypothetical protein
MLRNLAARSGVEAATMQRFALVLLAAGALAAPAAAKTPVAKVCGASGCTVFELTFAERSAVDRAALRAAQLRRPPALAEYYSISFGRHTRDASDGQRYWYVPATGSFALDYFGEPVWQRLDLRVPLLQRLTARIEPFARPRIVGARVGGRVVQGDASGYARLLRPSSHPYKLGAARDWVPIDLVAAVRSPWTDGPRNLLFSLRARAVRRGDVLVPLSARVARAVAAARPLA